jgi:acetylornithine/N-succinyldiaminopimelate aminotransferase
VGAQLATGIAAVQHPLLAGVRGRGLWLAALLSGPAAPQVEAACVSAGFLVNAVAPNAIRLAPPLILSSDQASAFTEALPGILEQASGGATGDRWPPFGKENPGATGARS